MRAKDLIFPAIALLAAVGASLLAAHGTWGVAGEWQWRHRDIQGARWWMPLFPGLCLIVVSLGLLHVARRGRRPSVWLVLPLVLLAFVLQLAVAALAPAPPSTMFAGAIILSPVATTYFDEAGQVRDLREFLRDYANRMRTFSQHAQTYPPGPIVFFWAVRKAVERSAPIQTFVGITTALASELGLRDLATTYGVLYHRPVSDSEAAAAVLSAWLLGLLGCLSIVPIYLLARDRWGAGAAACAAALTATVPSLILFAPSILQLVTVETALLLYLLHRAWSRRSPAWSAAAGAMWTIAALTSLAMLAIPLLLIVWAVIELRMRREDGSGRSPWHVAGWWIAGALAVFVVAYLALGINFPAIVRSALGAHREVTTRAFARTYSRWLGWNLFDFWMFLGAGLGVWMMRQMWTEGAATIRRQHASLTPVLWAVIVTLVALDVSGVVRAEVGRIWMFLMVPAAAAVGKHIATARRADAALAVLLVAQLIQIYAFQTHLALFVVL
jgi:hypothetical protein